MTRTAKTPAFCNRCGQEFDRTELRAPSAFLRLLAAPFLLPLMLRSAVVRGEANALSCRPCRRQLNVCFSFLAFVVLVVATSIVTRKLGLAVDQGP